MSNRFLDYLEREHSRLDELIAALSRQPRPDHVAIGRLNRQKLLIRNQIDQWHADLVSSAE